MSHLSDTEAGDRFALPERMPGAPRLPGSSGQPGRLRHERHGVTAFGGLAEPGQSSAERISRMTNLIPRGYPALVTKSPLPLYVKFGTSGPATGLAVHRKKLVGFRGSTMFTTDIGGYAEYGTSTRRGQLTRTAKKFASFGEQLFIIPDLAVYDTTDDSLTPVLLDTGELENVSIDYLHLVIPQGDLVKMGFRAGDCISLEVLDHSGTATPDGYYKLSAVTQTNLLVAGGFPVKGVFTVRIRRVMPDLEGICAMGNRLYGFAGRTVYASEEGNPWNWYATRGISEEKMPFSLTTDGEESFTACTVWQGTPLFFKENGITRLSGRTGTVGKLIQADVAVLTEQSAPGVPLYYDEAICELDGVLYYSSGDRLYRYSGGLSTPVSQALPDGSAIRAIGTDGHVLYVSVRGADETNRLYLYDPEHGWYCLAKGYYTDLLKRPVELISGRGKVCLLQREDGAVFMARSFGASPGAGMANSDDPLSTSDAEVEFGDDTSLLPDGGRLLTVYVRANGQSDSQMQVSVQYDGGNWQTLATLGGRGREYLYRVPVPPRPCQWFRLKLSFTGTGTPGAVSGLFRVYGLWWDTEPREAF